VWYQRNAMSLNSDRSTPARSTARPLDRSTARPLDRSTARQNVVDSRVSLVDTHFQISEAGGCTKSCVLRLLYFQLRNVGKWTIGVEGYD